MSPPCRSGILPRAHPHLRCPRSGQAHSPGAGSVLLGSHTPQGARTPSVRAARAAAAQPLRALNSLLSPAHQPVTPQELRPIGQHLPPRLTPPPIGRLPARGGAGSAGTQTRGPQPGGREGRRGHVGRRGASPRGLRGHFGGVGVLRTRAVYRLSIPWALWEASPVCSSHRKSRSLSALHLPPHKPEFCSVTFCRKFLRSLPTSARPRLF